MFVHAFKFAEENCVTWVGMKAVQLVYLSLFFSLCGATEYYVRPTEPTNTSCPAQPCLTLSQYISSSDLYFKSNTVFKFLPGLHHTNQTLDMRSVENVSLEGECNSNCPLVMMDIHCSSIDSAGFHFMNISNLDIHSLNFSVFVHLSKSSIMENMSVSGFLYTAVNGLQMHHSTVQFASSQPIPYSSGIAVFSSKHIMLHSLAVACGNDSVGRVGIVISISQYTTISSTIVVQGQKIGIFITDSNNTDIVNTEISCSRQQGLAISFTHHTTVTNTSVTESFEGGIAVFYSTSVTFFNTSVMFSCMECYIGKTQEVSDDSVLCYGLFLLNVSTAALHNIGVMYSKDNGILVFDSYNITIENTAVAHTGGGILSLRTAGIQISFTTISTFSNFGIVLLATQYSIVTNVTVILTKEAVLIEQSEENGIFIQSSQYAIISSTVVKHVKQCGILIRSSNYTTVSNTGVMYTQYAGICIDSSQYTTLSGAVVMYAEHAGVVLSTSNDTDIVNTAVLYSGLYGLAIHYAHHVTVTHTRVTESSLVGIFASYSTNVDVYNTSVMYSGTRKCVGKTQTILDYSLSCFGLLMGNVGGAVLNNIQVMYSEDKGISAISSSNITLKNATVTHTKEGIYSSMSSNIRISFTIISNFSRSGINVAKTQYSVISNVTIVFTPLQEVALHMFDSHTIEIEAMFLVPNSPARSPEVDAAANVLYCSDVSISRSVFSNISNPFFHQTFKGHPTVFLLFSSNYINFSDCTFKGNNITGLVLSRSHLTILGTLNFTGNKASRGAAMLLVVGSTMKLLQNGSIYFVNNTADFEGGAIYLDSSNSYGYNSQSTLPDCFLQVEQADLHKGLIFMNNSAGQGGDALYGRILGFYQQTRNVSLNCSSLFDKQKLACLFGEQFNEYYINCSVLFTEVSSITPNTLSQVASDPTRVCICNNGTPACHMTSMAVDPIFPGQSFSISTAVTGLELGTVAGSVFANFLPLHSIRPQLAAGEDTQEATQLHCNRMEYTIFSINSTEVLVLTADSSFGRYTNPSSFTKSLFYVNITLLPCPPGFALMEASARCDCSQFVLQLPGISCNIKDQTIHRSGLVWVGSVKDENQTVENVITAKYCPLNYCKREDISVHLNQPDTQCEFNHSGILCGRCHPGLSLMLGGVQCGVCSNNNLALIIPFILAGVVLVFFLKISNLTTSEGFINSLVFYTSVVKANEHIFLPQANTNPLTLFISWLNLDLGVQTCFFNGLSAYTKTWLQFVFPFYIWGITGVIIISARYSIWIARISGNNSVPVLATLFLLSYAKLLRIIITSLSYTVLEYPGGQKVVWSADGNINYLGAKHAPLFVAAVATLLFLWLPYTVLLFTGQWLYKCKLSLINRMLIKLKPFLDAHYGPLKDSHRYWFGALLLVRAVILLISALVTKNNFSVFVFSISVATVVLIAVLMAFSHIGIDLQAYRSKTVSYFEFAIFLNLLVLCLAKYHTSVGGGSEIAASYTLIGIVFLQFVGLLIFRIFSVVRNMLSRYFPKNESKEEEGVWRYDDPIEMQTTQYRNVKNVL